DLAANTTFGGSSVTANTELGTVRLSASNGYSGTITVVGASGTTASVTNGFLQLNNLNAVQNATVTLNTTGTAPALTFLNTSNTGTYIMGALASGANNPALVLNDTAGSAVTLNVGGNNAATTTYGGTISGSGSLIKSGTGMLVLSASSSYTGTTTIQNGT